MATAAEQLAELDSNPELQNVLSVQKPVAGATAQAQLAELEKMDLSQAPTPVPGLTDEKKGHGVRSAKEAIQTVQKGALAPFLLPLDIIDFQRTLLGEETADRLGTPQRIKPTADQALANQGMVPQPGDEPEGIMADTLDMFGTSLPFGFGLGLLGKKIGRDVPKNLRGMMQQSLADIASSPRALAGSTALDLSSSFGASIGNKAAEELELGPMGTVTAQLIGGFAHPLSVVNRVASGGFATRVRDSIMPGGSGKDQRRAARELQRTVENPEVAAANLDISSDIPAARQIGSEGSLQLERRVLNTDPKLRQQYTDDLNEAIDLAIADGRKFGDQKAAGRSLEGQSKRAITLSKQQADHNIRLLELRSAQAGQEAEIAISQLGPDASVDDISRIVRDKTEEALKAARILENDAWAKVDGSAVVQPTETMATVKSELDAMSKRFGDKSLIPGDVKKLIAVYRNRKEIPLTLDDVKAVRTKVNELYDSARREGRKNEARVLNDIRMAMRKDIEASGAAGIEHATSVSAKLNEKFTQGAVGDVLALRKGGVPKVQPRETLQTITGRRGAKEGLEQLIKGDPSIEGNVRDFVTSSYYTSVLVEAGGKPGRIQALHNQFIRRMKKQGVLDVFPDVEAQLVNTRNSVLKDATIRDKLKVAHKQGGVRLKSNRQKMLANEYMGGNGDIVLDGLLTSKNPIVEAKKLVKTMEGNPGAMDGLKAGFMDSLYRKATNSAGDIDHKKLAALISNNRETAKAIGMNADEIARMDNIQKVIGAANMAPKGSGKGGVVNDNTGFVLEVLARWTAVSAARVVPTKGAGASLQMANLFSTRMKRILDSVGRDGAAELIKAAHTDNKLYQALLTSSTDSVARQVAAAKHIQAWLPALALQDDKRFSEDQ